MRKQKKTGTINTCLFCNNAADFCHLTWWSPVSPFYGEAIGICWGCYRERTTKLIAAYKNIVAGVAALEAHLDGEQ